VILPVVLSLCFLSQFFFSSSGHKNTERERERVRERASELLQQSVGVYSFFIPSLWKCRNLDQELAAVAEGRRRRNRNRKNRKKRNGFCVIFNSEVLPGLGDKGFWFCQGLFCPFFFALFCEVFFSSSFFLFVSFFLDDLYRWVDVFVEFFIACFLGVEEEEWKGL